MIIQREIKLKDFLPNLTDDEIRSLYETILPKAGILPPRPSTKVTHLPAGKNLAPVSLNTRYGKVTFVGGNMVFDKVEAHPHTVMTPEQRYDRAMKGI